MELPAIWRHWDHESRPTWQPGVPDSPFPMTLIKSLYLSWLLLPSLHYPTLLVCFSLLLPCAASILTWFPQVSSQNLAEQLTGWAVGPLIWRGDGSPPAALTPGLGNKQASSEKARTILNFMDSPNPLASWEKSN